MPFQPLGYKKGKQTNEKQQHIKNKITTKHCTVVSMETILLIKVSTYRDKEKQNKITKRSIFISSYISG